MGFISTRRSQIETSKEQDSFDFERFKEQRQNGERQLEYADLRNERAMRYVYKTEGMNNVEIAREIRENPNCMNASGGEVLNCLQWHGLAPGNKNMRKPPWRELRGV